MEITKDTELEQKYQDILAEYGLEHIKTYGQLQIAYMLLGLKEAGFDLEILKRIV